MLKTEFEPLIKRIRAKHPNLYKEFVLVKKLRIKV
jgi:hypothetical protein